MHVKREQVIHIDVRNVELCVMPVRGLPDCVILEEEPYIRINVGIVEMNSMIDFDHAWNLDMGSYSYGWYRDKNGLHDLGLFR